MPTPAPGTLDSPAIPTHVPFARRLVAPGVALLSGGLLSLSFPGWDAGFLAWFAIVPFFILLLAPRKGREYATLSAAFGFGFFGGVNYWLLAMHPLTWLGGGMTLGVSLVIVLLAWSLMALILSLSAILAFTAAGLVLRRFNSQGRLKGWQAVLVLSSFWVAMEYFQANGTFGYAWGVLASSQYKTLPLLQSIALVGPFPLSGLIVAVNAAIAWLITRREWKPLAGCLAITVAASVFGAWWLSRPVPGSPLKVALVQGDISQTEKWKKGNEFRILDTYLGLSNQAKDAQLVVWPESALPVLLAQNPTLYNRLSLETRARHQYLLTGTFNSRFGPKGQMQYFNATTMFDPLGDDIGWDAKKHLVPFGEYLPWRDTLPAIWAQTFAQLNLFEVDITPGDRPMPFPTNGAAVGTNVCFDSIFPDVLRKTAQSGAQLFVLVTNDSWYKRTYALQQHLAHGVLRAVENRRPFLQAANTGATAVVDHTGRIVAMGKTWEPLVVQGSVTPVSELTPYTRFGDWLSWLMTAVAGLFALYAWRGLKRA
jgi:apolipoprotein N-acyltransferase